MFICSFDQLNLNGRTMEVRLLELEWLFSLCMPRSSSAASMPSSSSDSKTRTFGAPQQQIPAETAKGHNQTAQDAAAKFIHKFRYHFFPTAFDSLPIVAAKLYVVTIICYCGLNC